MKNALIIMVLLFLAIIQSGCIGFVQPGVYPVYSAPVTYYDSGYYVPSVGYYGGGRHYAPAHAARPHGPTPSEVVFGKGALKQHHNNKFSNGIHGGGHDNNRGGHGGGNNHGNNSGGHGSGNDNRGNRGGHR